MDSFYLQPDVPGILTERLVTAQAASILTGYNIQHIRRLAFNGKLEAIRVGRSWLIRVDSLEKYLNVTVPEGDARFGPRSTIDLNTHQEASA